MNMDCSKQFLSLLGVPAIIRTIWAFESAARVNSIVIVCREEDAEQMERCVMESGSKKIAAVVTGGKTRQQSVANGACAAPHGTVWLAVHDGARPLVLPTEIDMCVAAAKEHGAAALAVPVKDTVKLADDDGFVESTLPRERLWAVQTPQVFSLEAYLEAEKTARDRHADYTDDCQLLESCGRPVYLCRGSYENLKLTTQDDVIAAEAVLRSREAHT